MSEKKDYKQIKENMEKPKMTNQDALENLKKQYKDHSEQARIHTAMALKAQGAIEVLEQLVENAEA